MGHTTTAVVFVSLHTLYSIQITICVLVVTIVLQNLYNLSMFKFLEQEGGPICPVDEEHDVHGAFENGSEYDVAYGIGESCQAQ